MSLQSRDSIDERNIVRDNYDMIIKFSNNKI